MSGERKYLPTLSDLVDRLTIVQQKAIFISERRDEYVAEMALIMHDIDLILVGIGRPIGAKEIHAIVVIMLANAWIWANETRIRDGSSTDPPEVQLSRLRGTHAVNGVRNTGKNVLASFDAGRTDYKIDALSADMPVGLGDWNIFK